MVLDASQVIELYEKLNDRYTAEELCEILGLTVNDLFNKFFDEVLEVDWGEIL